MKNRWKIAIAVLVVCILAILPCFYFMSRKESYEVKAEAYQIVGGEEVVFPQNAVLNWTIRMALSSKVRKSRFPKRPSFLRRKSAWC